MRIKRTRAKMLIMLLIALGLGNTPVASASDTQVLLGQVQVRKNSASDQFSHLHEAVVIKNDSEDEVDITSWCLNYYSVAVDYSDGTKRKIGCFTPTNESEKVFLKGATVVRFGSFDPEFYDPSIFYAPSFSQGLGNEKGKLVLLDSLGMQVDRVEWGNHPNAFKLGSGTTFGRKVDESGLMMYTGRSQDDFEIIPYIDTETVQGIVKYKDSCPEMSGFQFPDDICEVEDTPVSVADSIAIGGKEFNKIRINEFLPNPAGADAGNEFIEFYNYGENVVILQDYILTVQSLNTGASKSYKLPNEAIYPGEYFALYNLNTHKYSLNNTAGKIILQLNNEVIDEASYSNAKEGYSWSLIGDEFVLSLPSPNLENTLEDVVVLDANGKVVAVKACAVGQERNPATGRCRKIPVIASLAPCPAGKVRNPETGRCKNIETKKTPAPCKPGQERNPATGRCRKIKLTTPKDVGDTVKPIGIGSGMSLIVWLVAGLTTLGIIGYVSWEWRKEMSKFFRNLIIRIKVKKR